MDFVLVDSSHLKAALISLSNVLATSVGPYGNSCLISPCSNSFILTSSSNRIISNIAFQSPILKFIQQSIRSQTEKHGDGGLFCGILLCRLLTCAVESSIPKLTISSILTEIADIAQTAIMESPHLKLKVTLDSVRPLLSVARSVFLSKCSALEGKDRCALAHADKQISLLVQAFLHSEASIGKVIINVNEKSSRQCLLNGIMYKSTHEEHLVLHGESWHSVSILLFSVMLTDELDCKEKNSTVVLDQGKAQLENAHHFIDEAVSCGIKVIACQKVVHPTIMVKLRRKGILVLHRLGKYLAEALEKSSGATPISSLGVSYIKSIPKLMGHLIKIEHMKELGDDLILLEGSHNSGMCSLSLSTKVLSSGSEIKIISLQVLSALKQVLQDSAVCPGGGCLEVFLCGLLWRKVQKEREILCKRLHCQASDLESVLVWFQKGLFEASGLNCKGGKLAIDTVFHHAWKGSNSNNTIIDVPACNCGLVNSSDVRKYKGSWSLARESFPGSYGEIKIPPYAPSMSEKCVFDVCSIKRSALILAVNNCIAISNIGAMVLGQT